MRFASFFLASFLLASASFAAETGWRSLWNEKDLTGWVSYLGIPDASTVVPGLPKKADGKYAEPLGIGRDPLNVFTVTQVDGRPAIRISGQIPGTLSTPEAFGNYHLRVQFKWGNLKWPPKLDAKRDSAIFFHAYDLGGAGNKSWPRCLEYQVTETDVGDVSTVTTKAITRGRPQGELPAIYDPVGETITLLSRLPSKGRNNHCTKSANFEKPHGEWNTLELYCLGDEAVFVVNGGMVMRVRDIQRLEGEAWQPLTSGFVCLQSKTGELFYRDIAIRPISAFPAEFAGK